MSWEAGDALQGTGLAGEMVARLKANVKKFDAKTAAKAINAEAAAIASYANSVASFPANVNAAWDVSDRFTADGDTSAFTLTFAGMSSREEDHEVYWNGLLMEIGQDADYTIGQGTGLGGQDQVLFTRTPAAGSKVLVRYMRGGRRWGYVDKFVGDGETSLFYPSWGDIDTDERAHVVTRNGVLLEDGPGNDYVFTASLINAVDKAILFAETPALGAKIAVRYMRAI